MAAQNEQLHGELKVVKEARVHEEANKVLSPDQQLARIEQLEAERDNYKRRLEAVKKKNESLKLKLAKARGEGPDDLGYRRLVVEDDKGHPMAWFRGLPKHYTGVRCDLCKRDRLEYDDFFYHSSLNAYDLCLRCAVAVYNPDAGTASENQRFERIKAALDMGPARFSDMSGMGGSSRYGPASPQSEQRIAPEEE